jgi:hypothetical protein
MAVRKAPLVRHTLHAVLVLLVFYPLGVYVYTYSLNRTTAENVIRENIDDALGYCLQVRTCIERLVSPADGAGRDRFDTVDEMREWLATEEFEAEFRNGVGQIGRSAEFVRFVRLYDGEDNLSEWGREVPGRVVARVSVDGSFDYAAVRERLVALMRRVAGSGTYTLALPVDLGPERGGRLVVGLTAGGLGSRLAALSDRRGMRALRL